MSHEGFSNPIGGTYMEERIYLVAEVADKLHVNAKTVRTWIQRGDLVAIRIGREWRIREQDLQAFISAHLTQSARGAL